MPGAEHVDPLAAGDLGVQAEVLRHLPDDEQPLGRHLAAGDPRDDRVACRPSGCSPSRGRSCPAASRSRRRGRGRGRARRGSRRRTGLQMSQPRPVPKRAMTALKVRSPETRTASNSCARRSAKCSHSAVLRLDAGCVELGVDELLDQGQARSARGAGAGARLDSRRHPCSLRSVTAQRIVPAVDVVARAHERLVGQSRVRRRIAGALRQQVGGRVGAERRRRPADAAPVRLASPTRMPPSRRLRVVGHHELLVDARHRVGVHDLERAGRLGEGVAEARDVDADQLELGGRVGAGEGRLAAEQAVAATSAIA